MHRPRFSLRFFAKLVVIGLFIWLSVLCFLTSWNFEISKFYKQKLSDENIGENRDFSFPIDKKKVFTFPKPTLSPPALKLLELLNLTDPGHMGKGINLSEFYSEYPSIPEAINKSLELYKLNEFVSKLIPLDRELPDVRSDYCKQLNYSSNLPMASVVMIFQNEALTMILRSVYSVLNRTPEHLLREIILIDDCSTHENLKKELDDHIAVLPKIRLIRSPTRIGLIKARMLGAINAVGPALVIMDSHIEVTTGWLEPLLDRLVLNKNTTAVAVVDILDMDTLEFRENDALYVAGFYWDMIFNWKLIPESEKLRRKHQDDPVYSPTMLGAFFVIYKEYFQQLGMYDPEYQVWGAENLELAFKVWLCGGQIETVPCSHVGHLYKKFLAFTWPGGYDKVIRWNTDRLAEVWLDDYKRYYYRKVGNTSRDFGDISQQKKLREDLHCKPFSWFIENIYPEVDIPEELQDSNFAS